MAGETYVRRAVPGHILKRPYLAVSVLIAASLGVFVLGFGFLERYFIYFPTRDLHDDPGRHGIPFEDVILTTDDGVRVHGWFVPQESAEFTVLWMHGNGGNISHRVDKLRILRAEVPANFFLLDYRGYGQSEGTPSEEGLYEDARAALDYLLSVDENAKNRLVYYGHSLGAAVAVDLAAHHDPYALILESPFPSIARVAQVLYGFLPVAWLVRTQYDSAAKIGDITARVLMLHGAQDEIIPARLGHELYDLANEPKQFVEVEGAGHNDVHLVDGNEYARLWRGFLDGQ